MILRLKINKLVIKIYIIFINIINKGIDLMKKLGFQKSPQPKFHKKLKTLKEIAEMFAKMFVKGNARELKVEN